MLYIKLVYFNGNNKIFYFSLFLRNKLWIIPSLLRFYILRNYIRFTIAIQITLPSDFICRSGFRVQLIPDHLLFSTDVSLICSGITFLKWVFIRNQSKNQTHMLQLSFFGSWWQGFHWFCYTIQKTVEIFLKTYVCDMIWIWNDN